MNENFILFTKIRDEHILIYLRHFEGLYKSVKDYTEDDSECDFYSIFALADYKVKLQTETDQIKLKRFKKGSSYMIAVWSIKYILIITLFLTIPIIKYSVLVSKMTTIYNAYSLFKDIANCPIYLGATLQSIGMQNYFLTVNGGGTTAQILANQQSYALLAQKYYNVSTSFNVFGQIVVGSDLYPYYQNLLYNNSCDFIPNSQQYCNATYVRRLFKLGIKGIMSRFGTFVDNSARLFNNKTIGLSPDKVIPPWYANELLEMYLMIFP